MDAYDIILEVQPGGEIHLENLPFSAGTEVEVIVAPSRAKPESFLEAWNAMVAAMRASAPQLTAEEIVAEIHEHRKGR